MAVQIGSKAHLGNRKVSKSVMEKKRRTRINSSVSELKSMLSSLLQLQGERFDKLEKADILEMTVNYIKKIHCQTTSDQEEKHPLVSSYEDGYSACVKEVDHYVGPDNVELKTRILSHLANRVTGDGRHEKAFKDVSTRNESGMEKKCQSGDITAELSLADQRAGGVPSSAGKQNTSGEFQCAFPTSHTVAVRENPNPNSPNVANIPQSGTIPEPQQIPLTLPEGTQPRLESLQYVSCFLQNGQLSILVPTNVIQQPVSVLASPAQGPIPVSPVLVASGYQSPSAVPTLATAMNLNHVTSTPNSMTPIGICLPQQIVQTDTSRCSPNALSCSPAYSDACESSSSCSSGSTTNRLSAQQVCDNFDQSRQNYPKDVCKQLFTDKNNNTIESPYVKYAERHDVVDPDSRSGPVVLRNQRRSNMWRPW